MNNTTLNLLILHQKWMEWHLREFTFKQADTLNTETDGYCWLPIFGIVMVLYCVLRDETHTLIPTTWPSKGCHALFKPACVANLSRGVSWQREAARWKPFTPADWQFWLGDFRSLHIYPFFAPFISLILLFTRFIDIPKLQNLLS